MRDAMWLVPVMLMCLGLSFFFSGMEAGVFALSRLHIRQQARHGNPSARLLHNYLEHPEEFLWTILVGNTLANFVAVSLAVCLLQGWVAEHDWLLIAVLVVLVWHLYTLADLLPKMLFRKFPNRLCLTMARPFRLVHLVLSPLVICMAKLAGLLLRWTGGKRFTGRLFGNREELRLVMRESAKALTSEEQVLVNRVLDLQNLTVGSLARPMSRVITVTTRTPIAKVLQLCREKGLTRLPIREESSSRIAGLVNLKTSLFRTDFEPQKTAGDYLQSAVFLDESMRLEVALRRLQRTGQRMAIVLGQNREEIGIITLEDILSFVFGEVNLA